MNRILFFISLLFIVCSSNGLAEVSSAKSCGPPVNITPGWSEGRAEVDFDGDGCFDYCRIEGPDDATKSEAVCTISYGPHKGTVVSSITTETSFDWGWKNGRAWIDINKDGRADYCRVTGTVNHVNSHIACSLSAGDHFEKSSFSDSTDNVTNFDWGYPYSREYRDCNSDGTIDFCRTVGNGGYTFISCSPMSFSNNVLTVSKNESCRYADPNRQKVSGKCSCTDKDNKLLSGKDMCSGSFGCAVYCDNQAENKLIDTRNGMQAIYEATPDCPR